MGVALLGDVLVDGGGRTVSNFGGPAGDGDWTQGWTSYAVDGFFGF